MNILEEKDNTGDIVRYEVDQNYTRETIIVKAGQQLEAGALLRKRSEDSKYTLPSIGEDDGTKKVLGVLLKRVDASAEDQEAVMLCRGPAIIIENALKYNSSASEEDVLGYVKDLENLGILVRKGI